MRYSKTAIPKDLVIGLHRTMCPGTCPDYSLFVYGDGRVVYEGRPYVAVKGKCEERIYKAQVKRLLDEFYRMNYFSLKDRYDPIASDGAVTKTSILAGGKTKEVVNCRPSQAPEELYQLEEMIDAISQSELWIRDRSGNPVLKP
jgi:uncharacterized protein DUF6438